MKSAVSSPSPILTSAGSGPDASLTSGSTTPESRTHWQRRCSRWGHKRTDEKQGDEECHGGGCRGKEPKAQSKAKQTNQKSAEVMAGTHASQLDLLSISRSHLDLLGRTGSDVTERPAQVARVRLAVAMLHQFSEERYGPLCDVLGVIHLLLGADDLPMVRNHRLDARAKTDARAAWLGARKHSPQPRPERDGVAPSRKCASSRVAHPCRRSSASMDAFIAQDAAAAGRRARGGGSHRLATHQTDMRSSLSMGRPRSCGGRSSASQ